MSIYRILEHPWVFRASQHVLAPGMDRIVTGHLVKIMAGVPGAAKILDVGCGPSSWLWKLGRQPVGLDLCHAYVRKFRLTDKKCVTASAAALPFAADSFDMVFSFCLLHHLPEDLAGHVAREMIRVTRPGGRVVVFDPVLPHYPWLRPVAWAICKLDRGRFIRSQADLESRILQTAAWSTKRITHSYLGTEGLFCLLEKAPHSHA